MKIYISIFLILISVCCKSQETKNNNHQSIGIMNKRFDFETFRTHTDSNFADYTINGNRIIQYKNEETIQEEISKINNAFSIVNIYFPNGILKREGLCFHGLLTGKANTYDQQGNLIKTDDFEKDYPINIEKLIEIMKNEYEVNIADKIQTFGVNRFVDKHFEKPLYEITVIDKTNTTHYIVYIIDGNTGEELFKTNYYLGQDLKETPVEQYKKSLQSNNKR